MNIISFKYFSEELEKISGAWGMLNAGANGLGAAMSLKTVVGDTQKMSRSLGKNMAPMSLKPSSSYSFDSGQFAGKNINSFQGV